MLNKLFAKSILFMCYLFNAIFIIIFMYIYKNKIDAINIYYKNINSLQSKIKLKINKINKLNTLLYYIKHKNKEVLNRILKKYLFLKEKHSLIFKPITMTKEDK